MGDSNDGHEAPVKSGADDLLERWFGAQAVIAPLLKRSLDSFQGEGHALLLLARSDAGMTPAALMRAMGISSGRTSNILRQLERKGCIERSRDDHDLRSVLIRPTELGREMARSAYARQKDEVAGLFELLGEKDARELVRIAERVARMNTM